jgi:hypothetical protein
MFDTRTTPLALAVCALAAASWMTLVPGATPAYILGWTLGGLIALQVVSALIQRAVRPTPSLARVLDAAERVNAERIGAPRRSPDGTVDHASR